MVCSQQINIDYNNLPPLQTYRNYHAINIKTIFKTVLTLLFHCFLQWLSRCQNKNFLSS